MKYSDFLNLCYEGRVEEIREIIKTYPREEIAALVERAHFDCIVGATNNNHTDVVTLLWDYVPEELRARRLKSDRWRLLLLALYNENKELFEFFWAQLSADYRAKALDTADEGMIRVILKFRTCLKDLEILLPYATEEQQRALQQFMRTTAQMLLLQYTCRFTPARPLQFSQPHTAERADSSDPHPGPQI